MKTCPTCGRSILDPKRPKRVCCKCGLQIGKHHKWGFNEQGRAEHRVCEDPENYLRDKTTVSPQQELPGKISAVEEK